MEYASIMDSSVYTSNTVIAVAACFGTLCAGIYVIWGPDNFFRRKGQCRGLVNLGNTCFLNAVLQGLASLSPVNEWLQRLSAIPSGPLSSALNETLTVLSEDKEGVHSPSSVLRALKHHRWCIDFQQQDSHELYHVILTTLNEEIVPCPSLLADLSLLIHDGGMASSVKKTKSLVWSKGGSVTAPKKPLKSPLQGLLSSELSCCTCHYSFPLHYETFDSISLSLPASQSQCTLQSCLMDYVKSETVHDVMCPQCSKVSGKETKQTFLKRLQLGRAPESLCIHFKRTVWLRGGQLDKNDCFVSFPLQLEASRFFRSPERGSGHSYSLCAVTEHLGGPFSGHYQTHRRIGSGKQWVCTSDTVVYNTGVHDVLNVNAYMLYYNRHSASR